MKEYALFPAADLHGSAGSMCPGEKEQRYKPYLERVRLHTTAIQKEE